METPPFEFTASAANSFPTVNADGASLQAQILLSTGLLRLSYPGGGSYDFPLVADDEPCPKAVFLSTDSGGTPTLQVGTVDFDGQPQYIEDYPLNEAVTEDEWSFDIADGGIGILDLRNLGRARKTSFQLHRVPVVLSITGIYLRVATLKWFPDSGMTPWYEIIDLPA